MYRGISFRTEYTVFEIYSQSRSWFNKQRVLMLQQNRIKLKHEINYICHILLKLWKALKQKNTVGLKTNGIIW